MRQFQDLETLNLLRAQWFGMTGCSKTKPGEGMAYGTPNSEGQSLCGRGAFRCRGLSLQRDRNRLNHFRSLLDFDWKRQGKRHAVDLVVSVSPIPVILNLERLPSKSHLRFQ